MTDRQDSPLDVLTAQDVMRTEVLTIARTASIAELERLLGEHRVSGMPVTDEAGGLIGVVSMRDLLLFYTEEPNAHERRRAELAVDEDQEVEPATVAEVMTGEVFDIEHDASLRAVAQRMAELGVHRLLVRQGGRHVGLLTATDVVARIASS